MADIVESTPAELNVEGQNLKEKIIDDPIQEPNEEGDCIVKECETVDAAPADTTDDAQAGGVKRKSDDAENEDEDSKKVKKNEEAAEDKTDGTVNGTEAENVASEETNGKTHNSIPEDEIIKKPVEEESEAPAEDVAASS